mmetsp:Transcript_11626/g.25164  ORF Transcript_11626/g.25164 Transcript_11626/m.25164 type:complete len:208 (+) Transcript_11626:1076-1699(+)
MRDAPAAVEVPFGPETPRGYRGRDRSGLVMRFGFVSAMVTVGFGGAFLAFACFCSCLFLFISASGDDMAPDDPPRPGRVLAPVRGWNGLLSEPVPSRPPPRRTPLFFFPRPFFPFFSCLLCLLCLFSSLLCISIVCSNAASSSASIIFLDAERFLFPAEEPLLNGVLRLAVKVLAAVLAAAAAAPLSVETFFFPPLDVVLFFPPVAT